MRARGDGRNPQAERHKRQKHCEENDDQNCDDQNQNDSIGHSILSLSIIVPTAAPARRGKAKFPARYASAFTTTIRLPSTRETRTRSPSGMNSPSETTLSFTPSNSAMPAGRSTVTATPFLSTK